MNLTLLQPHSSTHKMRKAALLVANAYSFVEPHSVANVPGKYKIREAIKLHPLAVAVHAHENVTSISVWKAAAAENRCMLLRNRCIPL